MAILVFVGLLTATQTLIAQNLNFSQSSPGNCDILITQKATNGVWIYTQKGVKAGSTIEYGTNSWRPNGAGFDAWRWRIKGATAYKLSGESSFTTIDPSIFQCITMSTSGEHIDVVWGSQNANA